MVSKEQPMSVVDVIQFEGSPDVVVWKSNVEDFNSATQLIVDETHEAIVLIEGKAALFGPGRHTLATENYFGLQGIQRFATGGDTPFPCKVYFVNKIHSMDMRWGTQDVLTVNDPKLDILLHLRLRGNLTYVVDNSLKFVEKFTGFARDFNPETTLDKFRGIISTEVTDCIAKIVNDAGIDYLDINAHLKEISQILVNPLAAYFEEYGARLVYFNVETITSKEDDLAEVQAAKSAARARVITATSEAQAREVQGYDWLSEKKADILQALASNDGSLGGMMGAGIGIMSVGPMGQNLTQVVDDMFDPNAAKNKNANPFPDGSAASQAAQTAAANAATGHVDVGALLGSMAQGNLEAEAERGAEYAAPETAAEMIYPDDEAKERPHSPVAEIKVKLKELKGLLDEDLISPEDYDAKKAELLERL